jgi:hypothetical protein
MNPTAQLRYSRSIEHLLRICQSTDMFRFSVSNRDSVSAFLRQDGIKDAALLGSSAVTAFVGMQQAIVGS